LLRNLKRRPRPTPDCRANDDDDDDDDDSAVRNFSAGSVFAVELGKSTNNLDSVGRLQVLLDACRLLVI
jgi:hypothetical protein